MAATTIDSSMITDDTVVDADINETANINRAKVAGLTMTAGVNLSALRFVVPSGAGVILADSSDQDHCNKILGMTTASATATNPILVKVDGEHEDLSWSWDLTKPIFIDTIGQLTQTRPISGFSQVVAKPITATKIVIDIKMGVKLA